MILGRPTASSVGLISGGEPGPQRLPSDRLSWALLLRGGNLPARCPLAGWGWFGCLLLCFVVGGDDLGGEPAPFGDFVAVLAGPGADRARALAVRRAGC